ncbi:MAG: DUF2807 domain-containing protein [Spirochaetales bacterium]
MKRVVAALAVLSMFAFLSCQAKFDLPWLKQGPQVAPSPRQTAQVGAFDTIRVEGAADLIFDDSVALHEVVMTSDSGKAGSMSARLDGTTLILATAEGMPGGGTQEFRVHLDPGFAHLVWTGMGTTKFSQPWKGKALTLELEGLGSIQASVEAEELTLLQKGAGEITASGSATVLHVRSSGLGQVDASELVSKTAVVESSGVGEVLVNASESLQVDSSGLGSVKYAGNPKSKTLHASGATSIEVLEPGN